MTCQKSGISNFLLQLRFISKNTFAGPYWNVKAEGIYRNFVQRMADLTQQKIVLAFAFAISMNPSCMSLENL